MTCSNEQLCAQAEAMLKKLDELDLEFSSATESAKRVTDQLISKRRAQRQSAGGQCVQTLLQCVC